MRTFLLTAWVCLLCVGDISAQLTLTQSSYPVSVIGTDSLKVTTSSSAIPALVSMANGSWDLSAVTDSSPVFFHYRVPTTIYQFADSNDYRFYIFDYKGNVQTDITSLAILEFGINIKETKYNITSLTGGAFDTFAINAQNILFSAPRTKIAFPATYHSSWISNYHFDLGFELTFLLDGDTLAPGIIKSYITEKDTVVGWGKMRVKDASGVPSSYLNVLQVQTTIMRTDSFFLKGAPLSPSLLTAFSVTQGQKDTTYRHNYYRPQELTPLAQVEFHDAAFTQPYKATTHIQRLDATSVNDLINEDAIKIYPNPVNSRQVSVLLPATQGAWSYRLQSITGYILCGQLNPANTSLVIPPSAAPGIYYITIIKDGIVVGVKSLQID